jgi:hypothetical protein
MAPGPFACKPDALRSFQAATSVRGVVLAGRGQIFMTGKRGNNPNWGRSGPFPPATATAFETQVKQLRLAPDQYVASAELRSWCERNRNNFYIPEWLLDEWGMHVIADISSAA